MKKDGPGEGAVTARAMRRLDETRAMVARAETQGPPNGDRSFGPSNYLSADGACGTEKMEERFRVLRRVDEEPGPHLVRRSRLPSRTQQDPRPHRAWILCWSGVISRVLSRDLAAPRRPFLWDGGCPPPRTPYPRVMTRRAVSWTSCDVRPRLCGLSPDGVCRAVRVTTNAVGSYPTVSPLPPPRVLRRTGVRRSVLCCTVPELAPGGSYPPSCPVVPGLSSAPELGAAAARAASARGIVSAFALTRYGGQVR